MGERGQGNLHVSSELDVVSQALWRRRRIVDQRHRIVFGSLFIDSRLDFSRFFFFSLPHAVDRIICGDAINPGPKICSRGKLSELLVRAQESLLNYLFGILTIPSHAISQAENIVAVPLDENAKGIPIARQRALHGDDVALRDGLGVLNARLHSNH